MTASPAVLAASAGWLPVSEAILAGLCHDLGNRIASLDALLQLLEDDDDDLRADVDKEVERLSAIVPTFRSLMGDMDAAREAQLLPDVLETVLDLHRRRRGLEAVVSEFRTSGEVPPVLANPARLGRLLILALDNVVAGCLREGVREVTVEASADDGGATVRMWGDGADGPHLTDAGLESLRRLGALDTVVVVQEAGEVRLSLPSLTRARAMEDAG